MKTLFDKQLEFQQLIKNPTEYLTPTDRIRACNIQVRRAIDELHESLREMPYDLSGYTKSKKIISLNIDKIVDELVDAQLFMINSLNILGVGPETFNSMCETKQRENISRFETKKRFREKNDNFLIVIEGPDGVGKTEICKRLSELTGHSTLRMPDPSNRDLMETFSHFYRKIVANIDDVLILDRFFPSSMIYGNYFNRDVPLSDINTLSKKRDIFVFVIDREEPFRGDEIINQDQWYELRNIYLTYAKSNKWKVINNDSTLDNCVKQILESLQF